MISQDQEILRVQKNDGFLFLCFSRNARNKGKEKAMPTPKQSNTYM